MNTSNLQVNQVLTYKELCTLSGEKSETGNSKPSQIKRWGQYIKLEEIKQDGKHTKYKILEIYPIPVEKQIRALPEDLEKLAIVFLDYLAKSIDRRAKINLEVSEAFLKKWEIYTDCGLVSKSFYDEKSALEEGKHKDFKNISQQEIISFYTKINKILSDAIRDMLKALAIRKIIFYEETLQVFDGEQKRTRYVTSEESTIIKTEIEYQLLRELDISSKAGLISPKKRKKFYKERNQKIKARLGLSNAQDGYKIGFTSDIGKKLEDYEKDIKILEASKYSINGKICAKAKSQAAREYERFAAEYRKNLTEASIYVPQDATVYNMSCLDRMDTSGLLKSFKLNLFKNESYITNFNSLVDSLMLSYYYEEAKLDSSINSDFSE